MTIDHSSILTAEDNLHDVLMQLEAFIFASDSAVIYQAGITSVPTATVDADAWPLN